MPLISIVTRHLARRAEGFERLVKSLLAQTYQDYQHLVIYNEPLGLLDANQSLARHKDEVTGDYVLIVDDDDYLVANPPPLLSCMDNMVRGVNPAIILVRILFMGKLFPDDDEWQRLGKGDAPAHGKISSSNYIIRRDIWLDCIHAFSVPDSGDYHFITEVYKHPKANVMLWDYPVVAVDHIGKEDRDGTTGL